MKPLANTTELSARLKAMWPDDLLDWTPTDREYQLVTLEELLGLVQMFPETRPWKERVNECEEIARRFMCRVRDHEFDTGMDYNRAVGVVFLTKHRGTEEPHTINIAFGIDAIYLADLQTGDVWVADPEQDTIYNVEM